MTEFDKALEVLNSSEKAARAGEAPLWLSVLVFVSLCLWSFWYLNKKLTEESSRKED